jgi:transcriptional regulator with XRE-family HTH domain
MPNFPKLKGRIVELYGTQEKFGEAIGVSLQTVNAKLQGRSGFSQEDIYKWAIALKIDQQDIGIYFFVF